MYELWDESINVKDNIYAFIKKKDTFNMNIKCIKFKLYKETNDGRKYLSQYKIYCLKKSII